MFKKSSIFTKQFRKIEFKTLNLSRKVTMIQKFPKVFFEILVIVSFTVFIFIMSFNNVEIDNTLIVYGDISGEATYARHEYTISI